MANRSERATIMGATIGSVLEWYEFYLFLYLSPVISLHFFDPRSEISAWVSTLMVFAIGFLSRPVGALIFGHLGDRWGRKPALLTSIIMITFPTIAIAFIPGYQTIGYAAPLILCLMRLLQGIPVGAEITGAMCYLYEAAQPSRKTYITSWTFFGSQIGAIFCTLEILFLQQHYSHSEFAFWGWRLSFLIGGLIGLFGLFLRYRLHESTKFIELKEHHELSPAPIKESFRLHKGKMGLGILLSAMMMTGNFVIFFFFPSYLEQVLHKTFAQSLGINCLMLIGSTITLPFLGKLGDKFSAIKLFFFSQIGLIAVSYPLFYSVSFSSLEVFLVLYAIAVLLLSATFSLMPVILAELFPTRVRYTCLGFSYNLCSSLLGGTAPIASLYLIHRTGSTVAPAFVVIFAGLLTLTTWKYFFKKEA